MITYQVEVLIPPRRDVARRRARPSWTLFTLFLLCSVFVSALADDDDIIRFNNPYSKDGLLFEKMVIDPSTTRLYVGGVDRLYDLFSGDLSVRVEAVTGPHNESDDCRGSGPDPCTSPKSSRHSYTKALAVYDRSSKLIECSSLDQGRCRLRNLHNVSEALVRSPEPMLANDAISTAAIFVSDGPSGDPALYVASTYVKGAQFRDEIPAMSTVRLSRSGEFGEFELSEKDFVSTGTALYLERTHREKYRIEYVSGFSVGEFAYFATRQPRLSDSSVLQSRLVRVCQGDKAYQSYTEVPLQCSDGVEDFNLLQDVFVSTPGYNLASEMGLGPSDRVLFGVFSSGDRIPSRRSAVCAFSMKAVEEVFQENIMNCYEGKTMRGLPWFKAHGKCQVTRLKWENVYCGNMNPKIGGDLPITSTAVLKTIDSQYTSIVVNTTRGSTVLFVGTSDGRIIKSVMDSHVLADIYEEVQVANEEILPDMEIDGTGQQLFILTPNQVIRMPTSRCHAKPATCGGCLAHRDPYCGWCVRSNTCSEESQCVRKIPPTDLEWLGLNTTCPEITSVTPDQMQISTSDFLNVTMQNMGGDGKTKMRCSFRFDGGKKVVDSALVVPSYGSLRCATPSMHELPSIAKGSAALTAQLSVVSEGWNTPIATTNFTFYDCSRFTSCSSCTSSAYPCDWCVEGNECVDGKLTEDRCRKHNIVNGLRREGPSRRHGPSHCPHIASHDTFFVPAGERRNISVKAQNMESVSSTGLQFKCQFHMNKVTHEKPAEYKDGHITCAEMSFPDEGLRVSGSVPVDFGVVWSSPDHPGMHPIDNVRNVSVEVYKCSLLASDCGRCLTLSASKYDCAWCAGQARCGRPRSCNGAMLSPNEMCPNPRIIDFHPKKGPVGGKTKIVISGSNLGRRVEDVDGKVTVANVRCDVVKSGYIPADEVVCETGRAAKKGKAPVVIQLAVNTSYTAISSVDFHYVQPEVTRLRPTGGPRGGGTDVTLHGKDLDAGSQVEVSLGGAVCEVTSRGESELVCRTAAAISDGDALLEVRFDAQPAHTKKMHFTYMADPRVLFVQPNTSIASGGILVDVVGSGFSLLQRPRMRLLGEQEVSGEACEVKNDELMECVTPALPARDRKAVSAARPLARHFDFDFDGAPAGRQLLMVTADPSIDEFKESRFFRPDEHLAISGEHIDAAAKDRDIQVLVGGVECQLKVVASRVVTCEPPKEAPPLGGLDPEIAVKIGGASYVVGVLSYSSPFASSNLLVGLGVFVAAMLALLLLLGVLFKRKSNSHQRQMKYLKNQMDTIEMKVATECKEAFAELQTSLNAYTADLPLGTPIVPFLDYKTYAARVLFPGSAHHPVLRDLEVDSERAPAIESGLREFHKLLMNKTFLLTLVRTMESNKYFLGKDRVYVGSLLMVVLQEKMGYCTEILRQLLRELIERTVEKKFQPKILFRRSESVAERMLAAWFTFLMHGYLQDCAGKKLYELYWGIKQQMEKGPQDALTLEARYSLSEEKLLRASVDFHELTIYVAGDSHSLTQPDIPVRVLDCDTITQVKEKCLEAKYRSVAFSDRPAAADIDLEWRTGHNGRIILQDVDSTCRVEAGGWKRLNTLAHYQLPGNSLVALVARHSSLYNLSLLSERSEKSMASLKQSPTLSRPFGTSSSGHSKDAEAGYKMCHLVKPSEHGPSDQQEKMVTEIYLTRLLMMKGTLQKFINDLLESIFSTSARSAPLPACIKYMFDFMDEQALEHGITDPEVVHAWKSNALPLRFWVNLIKNPHFLFDIQKPTKVEGCLSVVAQTLMDACSTQDHQLTKDSPSSKLLFAKDMYQYRDWVDSYYTEIARMPAISDQDMASLLNEESKAHKGQFYVFSALNELYKYLDQYKEPLLEALEYNEHAQASRLPGRLQDMLAVMESQRLDYDSSTLGYNSGSRLMSRDRL